MHEVTKDKPCIFIGDFNCVRFSNERMACSSLNQDHIHFNQWIMDSNLIEIPLINAKFTWIGPANRRSRLDRAFINLE